MGNVDHTSAPLFLGVWNTPIVNQIWTYVLILAIVYFIISFFRLKLSSKKENNSQVIQVINALEVK